MKLSEAIMLGSIAIPQAFGCASFSSNDATCALGAVRIACGVRSYRDLEKLFPFLKEPAMCPECREQTFLMRVIWLLNDKHKWSRERIASWVASIEPSTPEATEGRDPIRTNQDSYIVENKEVETQ